jgi:sodium-dependent dicarboxylate transporter 2/3/5
MSPVSIKRIGLIGGPLLSLLCYHLLPLHYSTEVGRATLGMMVWMAAWWLTEAVEIEVTALLPIATFPLLGFAPLSKVLPPYAADVIFLFMGGFMAVTAFLSMWVSNTVRAAMMVPIVLSVIATIIGSPPNGIAVRYMQQTFQKEVRFFDWLLIGGRSRSSFCRSPGC